MLRDELKPITFLNTKREMLLGFGRYYSLPALFIGGMYTFFLLHDIIDFSSVLSALYLVLICVFLLFPVLYIARRWVYLSEEMSLKFSPYEITFAGEKHAVVWEDNSVKYVMEPNIKGGSPEVQSERMLRKSYFANIGGARLPIEMQGFSLFVYADAYYRGKLSAPERIGNRCLLLKFPFVLRFLIVFGSYTLLGVLLEAILYLIGDKMISIELVLFSGYLLLLTHLLLTVVRPKYVYGVFKDRLYVLTKKGDAYIRDLDQFKKDELSRPYIKELSIKDNRRILTLVNQYLKQKEKKQG